MAIITSNDERYNEYAPALAKAIKESFPQIYLLLAGSSEIPNVDGYVNARVNNFEMLKSVNELRQTKPYPRGCHHLGNISLA